MDMEVLERTRIIQDGKAVITSTIRESLSLQELQHRKQSIRGQITAFERQKEMLILKINELEKNINEVDDCINSLQGVV